MRAGWPCGTEKVEAIAAGVVNGVVNAGADADHLALGNALLLVPLALQIPHLGFNATASEFKAELPAAAGGEQPVHLHTGEAIQQQQR